MSSFSLADVSGHARQAYESTRALFYEVPIRDNVHFQMFLPLAALRAKAAKRPSKPTQAPAK